MKSLSGKQLTFLENILGQTKYELTRNIEELSSYDAAVIIAGLLNDGEVPSLSENENLTEEQYKERQRLFNSLVKINEEKIPNIDYATEKQINYIETLCLTSDYELKNKQISKMFAHKIIQFLLENKKINTTILEGYLKIKEKTDIPENKNSLTEQRQENIEPSYDYNFDNYEDII